MNDFSMLDEIEKYLLEIFGDKINALEIKQRFYERILKKIEQLEGEEKTFLLLKMQETTFDLKTIPLFLKTQILFPTMVCLLILNLE